uniref:AlNc14C554G12141 protein n=1 Tax=Albugo laibachii Nc14 TaxID=890382 RepID=F0X148_9STRA|nr:AlNc14C554G12141 [Albugo laibachii Nc14]|eukprot:CCA27503.1 AlNc14C554G12141 [Albugo laibachii Nc14]
MTDRHSDSSTTDSSTDSNNDANAVPSVHANVFTDAANLGVAPPADGTHDIGHPKKRFSNKPVIGALATAAIATAAGGLYALFKPKEQIPPPTDTNSGTVDATSPMTDGQSDSSTDSNNDANAVPNAPDGTVIAAPSVPDGSVPAAPNVSEGSVPAAAGASDSSVPAAPTASTP